MNCNGTDRDIALTIVDTLSSCATLISNINDTLFVPHIITQPTDYTGALNTNATFTVVADNVASYKWQSRKDSPDWEDTTTESGNTNSYVTSITTTKLGREYRCKITGLDGSIIYSDSVQLYVSE